jgi:hypothetical protein
MSRYVCGLFHNKFHMLSCNISLVITTKDKRKYKFRVSPILLFYVLQLMLTFYHFKTGKFSGPYIKQAPTVTLVLLISMESITMTVGLRFTLIAEESRFLNTGRLSERCH